MSKNKKKNLDFKMTEETEKTKTDNNFFFGEAPEKKDDGVTAEEENNRGAKEKTADNNELKTNTEKTSDLVSGTEPKKREKDNIAYFIVTAGVLTLICSAVALMLGFVNFVTKDVIAEKEEAAKKAAVYEIFPEAEEVVVSEGEKELFIVKENGALSGYCISTVTAGYGGDINLIVGVTGDGVVKGVKIVSMSETAGLGSKTQSPSFLSQFVGKSGKLTVGENVDGVSGATISSKAVTAGVEQALNYPVDLKSVAAELGITSGQELSDSEETVTEESKPETEITTDSADFSPSLPEQAHIDPSLVGTKQDDRYYEKDYSYTATQDTVGSYIEKEIPDTDTDTQSDESSTT